MFSLLIVQALCGAYCNETSTLPDGIVCCNNETCSGYCYIFNQTEQYCVSNMEKFICVDTQKGYFAIVAVFFVPTLIMMFVSCIKRAKVPAATWVCDLILNLILGTAIYGTICIVHFFVFGAVFTIIGFILLFWFGLFRLLNPCYNFDCGNGKDMTPEDFKRRQNAIRFASSENCCRVKEDDIDSTCACSIECLDVLKDLKSPKVPKDELKTIIEENHIIPPTPQIEIIDFTENDNGISINETRYQPIQYGSWEEDVTMPQIDNEPIIAYRCHSKYIYNDDMAKERVEAKAQARDIDKYGGHRALVEISETAGITHRVIGVDGDSCVVECCTSCFVTNFLYRFLSCIGYSSIIDTIWFSSARKIEDISIKKIAFDKKTYRAKCGERDRRLLEYAKSGEA